MSNSGSSEERIKTKYLDPTLLQMVEILASLIPEKSVAPDAEEQLDQAIINLIEQTVPEHSSFFVSKNVNNQSTLDLTYNALRAIDEY